MLFIISITSPALKRDPVAMIMESFVRNFFANATANFVFFVVAYTGIFNWSSSVSNSSTGIDFGCLDRVRTIIGLIY